MYKLITTMLRVLFSVSVLFPLSALAMFCPTNFNSINLGYSIEQVQQVCGRPASSRQYQMNNMISQEWTYYIKPKFGETSQTKMRILLKNDKVIHIDTVTHDAAQAGCSPILQLGSSQKIMKCYKSFDQTHTVSATTLCGPFIQIGDSAQIVENSCGQPDFVSQSQQPSSAVPTDVFEMRYETHPAATLIFENGLLTDRKFD